jgi:general stress protein 26
MGSEVARFEVRPRYMLQDKHDKQGTYYVKLKRVHATTVSVRKQKVLHILCLYKRYDIFVNCNWVDTRWQ